MLLEDLNIVTQLVKDWCEQNYVPMASVPDTVGVQGVRVYTNDKEQIRELFAKITPLLNKYNIYVQTAKVRGGVLITFSLRALSEHELFEFLKVLGEGQIMSLNSKLEFALSMPLHTKTSAIKAKATPADLDITSAAKNIAETMYKDAISGMERSNQTSRQRNLITTQSTYAGKMPRKRKAKKTKAESKISFESALNEALTGMATPTGLSPDDIFNRFGEALTKLGETMGVGPLQDKLKERGINFRKAKDRQSIIFYIINAKTNAPQPISRITAETLAKPHDFETQLLNMLDYSKGEAPGAFKQRQEQLREQEKAVRDVAKSLNLAQEVEPQTAATIAASPKAAPSKPSPTGM